MCLQRPLHAYVLLRAILSTMLFASRLAPIKAFPHTFIVVETWACRITFSCTPHRRFGVVEPRPIGVAEGVPLHAVILPGCRPALPMRSNKSLVPAVLPGAGKVSLVVYEHLSQAVLEADAPGRDVNYVTVWVDNHF